MRSFIKRVGRPTVAALAYYSGYCGLAVERNGQPGGRIFSYHGINDAPDNPYAVHSAAFASHMAFLRSRCTVLSVDQIVALLRSGQSLPPRAVAVTIDDGYSDAYSHAFPILRQLTIPATIFLPVGFIDNRAGGALDRMSQAEFLTWEQVREMRLHGIGFGSHTVDHVSLTRVTADVVQDQLARSKDRIEAELGEPVTGFAYPYGTVRDVSPQVERLVAGAGYAWAVTGVSGRNDGRSDLFALRRIKIERGDNLSLVAKAAQGALDPWAAVDRLGRMARTKGSKP